MRIRFALCAMTLLSAGATGSIAQDKLRIQGIAGGDSVVVLIRNAAGCGSEQIFRSSGETVFGNLRPSPGCPIDLAIFSQGNAMYFESPVNAWTSGSNDVHTVGLKPLINVPVSVWVMDDATKDLAEQDVDKARDLYRTNRVGIQLAGTVRKLSEVAADSSAIQIVRDAIRITTNDLECQNLGAIQRREFYSSDRLNVYYVDKAFTGRNCAILATPPICTKDAANFPSGDGNISFIGTTASVVTLAHELGHAFGLRPRDCGAHTNNLPDFRNDVSNIMFVPRPGALRDSDVRNTLTLGQVFRMNTHRDAWGGTMLIKNKLRTDPARECPLNLPKSDLCPVLATPWPN